MHILVVELALLEDIPGGSSTSLKQQPCVTEHTYHPTATIATWVGCGVMRHNRCQAIMISKYIEEFPLRDECRACQEG